MKKSVSPPEVKLTNIRTGEIWICEDIKNRRVVDGLEFVEVRKPDNQRKVWINLNTLVKS